MKELKRLFERVEHKVLSGELSGEISELVYDTKKVTEGCLFVAIRGANFDAHTAVCDVAENGAAVIVVEDEAAGEKIGGNVAVVKVESTRRALAELSAAYFDYPADTLKVIGITGTKGKTTTTYMIKSILENAGYRTGLIGTIEAIVGENHIPAKNTTPESYELQKYFRQMLDAGDEICVMEVSSQGLMMHRVDGFEFELGIFTNIEPDHIGPNEHKDFDDYLRCKSLLFSKCKKGILNADDEHIEDILKGHSCEVRTFGFTDDADYVASDVTLTNENGVMGVAYVARCRQEAGEKTRRDISIEVDVPGRFSVYNSLCAVAVCLHFGVSDDAIRAALKSARAKGRIELVHVSDEYTLMIDYAHNAMALKSLLTSLKEYEPKRIVTLFGCGGNRDRNRRFEMGEVSGRLSDLTIITSDNPRFEEPEAILSDIETGIQKTDGKYVKITDRKEAIRYAIENAKAGDCIILAGKGHEDYQEICGVKHPMDERVLIAEVLDELR